LIYRPTSHLHLFVKRQDLFIMDEEYDVILLGTGLKVIEKKQEKKNNRNYSM